MSDYYPYKGDGSLTHFRRLLADGYELLESYHDLQYVLVSRDRKSHYLIGKAMYQKMREESHDVTGRT